MRAVAVVEITQLRALPQRVIDILHRQRRPARGPPRTPAGIGHPQITHQRGDRPAVGGDMVHHGHQHVLVVGDAEKPCPQRDLGGQIKRVTRRGVDGLIQPACRPAGGIDDLPAEVGPLDRAPPPAGVSPRPPQTACAGSHGGPPHRPAPHPTRRHQGARPAATPPPCCRPVRAPATGRGTTTGCWANDNGTTAGRSPATNGSSRPASPPIRGANWATVGASNTARTERSASRPVLIAAIRRIADSESPPRSKNESSTPTRSSTQHLGVDAGQDLLDRAGRGAVTIGIAGIRVPAGRGCRVCR